MIAVRYHLYQNSTKIKSSRSCRSGKSSLILEGAMILCLQCAGLSMTFELWKFQKLWLYTEHVTASCVHSQATKGLNIFSSQKMDHWSIKYKGLGSNSKYLDTGFNKCRAWHTCASSCTIRVNVWNTRWNTTVHKPNPGLRFSWVTF